MNIEKEMDEALHYVSRKLDESSHNSKPVLLHSFKVGMILYNNSYDREVILSGILHDLIEDTDTTKEEIEKIYGKKISNIVASVSFDPSITDNYEQSKEMFERTYKEGKSALLVKCADLLDNINYVHLSSNKESLLKKYDLFIEISKDIIGEEQVFKDLKRKIRSNK